MSAIIPFDHGSAPVGGSRGPQLTFGATATVRQVLELEMDVGVARGNTGAWSVDVNWTGEIFSFDGNAKGQLPGGKVFHADCQQTNDPQGQYYGYNHHFVVAFVAPCAGVYEVTVSVSVPAGSNCHTPNGQGRLKGYVY